ncbi:MAG TPA: DUF4369 domain-containing protein [Lutibacter sp.]|nr:DUF4369 domain-containing protein [Lutibacter sp.]
MKHSNFLYFLLLIVSLNSCKDTKNTNFVVQGTIKGLTKGTVFLDKVQDTLIVAIDSFKVRDNGHFILGENIESPEIYYLRIKEIPNKKLLIFGEKSIIDIEAQLDKFDYSAKVTGSKNHELLTTYKEMIQQFKDAKLKLFKENLEAEKANDKQTLDSLEIVFKRLNRRQYLYTTNFAVNNADKEVAPYIALTELYNAKLKLLDTINNALSEDIRNSKYGKQLDRFIAVIKKNEGVE